MPPPLNLPPDEFEAHVKRLARERKARQRAREKARSRDGHGTPIKEGHVTAAVTPSLSSSLSPESSTNSPPPAVARLSERLVGFGRGYKPDPTRLAKLLRAFPHLDQEEEVADALDWLDWPENKKRHLSIGFLRNWFAKSEAKRTAPMAPSSQGNGHAGNGVNHQPASRQRNPGPEGLTRLERELVPINRDDFQRTVAARRDIPLKQRLALAKSGRHG